MAITIDGWINTSYEKKIQELNDDIKNLKKSKLIIFPTFDKKWRNAFRYTFISLGIVTVFLIINIVQYCNRTKELAVEKNQNQKSATIIDKQKQAIEDTKTVYTKQLDNKEHSLEYYRTENVRLQEVINNQTSIISSLRNDLQQVRNALSISSSQQPNVSSRVIELENEIKSLNKTIEFWQKQAERLKDIGYNVGVDINNVSSCKIQFCRETSMKFDAINPLKIEKIRINAKKEGAGEFTLYDKNNIVIKRISVKLSKGEQYVLLNLIVRLGNDYTLGYTGDKIQAINECFSFPYIVRNLIKLKQAENNQYSFFNWRVYANI